MDLLVSKICSAILLAVLRLLAGLLPLKVYRKLNKWGRRGDKVDEQNKRKKRIDLFLSLFLCFGAGLLLSTCFIHMIPEVRESFEEAASSGHWPILERFPFAEGVVCLGFFIVYLFEELGERLISQQSKKKSDEKQEHTSATEDVQTESSLESSNHQHQHQSAAEDVAHGHSHGPNLNDLEEKSLTAAIRGFLLVFALSFHSIFEGMAIGLQPKTKDVWFLFAAVTVHELAIMFCVGLEMLTSKVRVGIYVVYMVTLGCVTPLGVVIGILVTEYVTDPTPTHTLSIAVLQAIAAGTLLYVTFMEVLERERKKAGNGLLKYFAVLVGFLLLSAMAAWDGHDENPGNHGLNDQSAIHSVRPIPTTTPHHH